MTGPEAAELFYRQDLFARRGAAPGRIQKTLLGQGGVQGLDGEAHRHRKQMFMSLMTPERIEELRSEEHTSELQSLMRISYAVFCLKKKKKPKQKHDT